MQNKSWFTMASGLIVMGTLTLASAGCQPGDLHTKTVRQRVLAGETVTFTKPGYTLCGKKSWTEMRIDDLNERERIVLQKQSSVLNLGHSVCYRIGDTVALDVKERQLRQPGRVRIDRVSLVLAEKVRPNHMKGSFFASSNNFNQYVSATKSRQTPDPEGIATVVDMTYVRGSAADESELRQKDSEAEEGDGYVETVMDGDLLPGSNCPKPYTYISIPADLAPDFTSDKLQSWYTLADFNCLSQGQIVDLSTAKGVPATAQVKITKIKKFRLKALDSKFFTMAEGYNFQTIRDRISKDNTKGSEWIVVIDFGVQK